MTNSRRIESVHVAAYIEQLQRARSAPTAKLRLAALRHLFDWMVIGQIMPTNPGRRGARAAPHRAARQDAVLDPAEARQLLDAIDTTTVIGLRDRALIGLMVYSFARIGASIGMRVEDVYHAEPPALGAPAREGRQAARHAVPPQPRNPICTSISTARGSRTIRRRSCFRPTTARPGQLTGNPLPQANAYAMIQRRARSADITTKIGNHTFRATGVTAYLKNGGTLETAARWRTMRARGRRSSMIGGKRN